MYLLATVHCAMIIGRKLLFQMCGKHANQKEELEYIQLLRPILVYRNSNMLGSGIIADKKNAIKHNYVFICQQG